MFVFVPLTRVQVCSQLLLVTLTQQGHSLGAGNQCIGTGVSALIALGGERPPASVCCVHECLCFWTLQGSGVTCQTLQDSSPEYVCEGGKEGVLLPHEQKQRVRECSLPAGGRWFYWEPWLCRQLTMHPQQAGSCPGSQSPLPGPVIQIFDLTAYLTENKFRCTLCARWRRFLYDRAGGLMDV